MKQKKYFLQRMGQNLDDHPGFQKIPGMPILLQHSEHKRLYIKSHFPESLKSI